MDKSGYQVSDLEDIEYHWEDPDLSMDAVSRPTIDIHFSHSNFKVSEMGSLAGKLNLIDKEEDKKKTPPTTPVSERPIRPATLPRDSPFFDKIFSILSRGFLFNETYCVCILKEKNKWRVSFYHIFCITQSNMCETKIVLVSLRLVYSVAAGLWKHYLYTVEKRETGHRNQTSKSCND